MTKASKNKPAPRPELEGAGKKTVSFVLAVFLLILAMYWINIFLKRSREQVSDRQESVMDYTIPEAWRSLPHLLLQGRLDEANAVLAGEDVSGDRPAEELYALGLLAGYFNDQLTCNSLLVRASNKKLPPVTGITCRVIENNLSDLALTKEELYRQSYDWEDAQFVSRAFLYRCIAESVLEGVPEGVEQAEALVSWVRRTVAPFEPTVHNAPPFVILARGYGVYDRMCWTLLCIARQAGIRGFMVHLMKPGTTEVPHTVCQIFPGGVPVLCDPLYGIVFRTSDGKPMDFYQACRDPISLRRYAPYSGELADCLSHAIIRIWPTEAQATFPRMKYLQDLADQIPLAPILYQDMDEEMTFVNTYIQNLPAGSYLERELQPAMAYYPHRVRRSFMEAGHRNFVAGYMKQYEPIAAARRFHLQGRFHLAERGYAAAIGSGQPPETEELASIFHAEALFELGQFADSRREFLAFVDKYPDSLWKSQAQYYMTLPERVPRNSVEAQGVSAASPEQTTLPR
ncbi:MAG TPA: hypothetical protein PLQ35_17050 [bacterium]|nr:hypothetical protein [bacterium]HQL63987.1 hypothetical protein [bacterium]